MPSPKPEPIRLIATTDAAAEAASLLRDELRAATQGGRRASIAISGGETPWAALALLRSADLDWPLVDVFQVDERVVPRDHPARNFTRMQTTLLARVPATAHPMAVDTSNLESAAAAYAATLPRELDIVQLGLGTDGHTASLVPGDAATTSTAGVAATAPYKGHRRLTLTFDVLNRARRIVWIVTGSAKREALAALLEGAADIPANRVARARAVVIADNAALGR